MVQPRISGIAIDCSNAERLCGFYTSLLGIERSSPDAFMIGGEGDNAIEVWFQEVEGYTPPSWPTQERGQQIHFDLEVEDRPAMISRALELGATVGDANPGGRFTVMLDPDGHPFCLCDLDHTVS
jgi:predicted enzyme related to lactoylglutathione lyase